MIGFGLDGTSVITERRGVIELLKVEGQANWILSVWCLPHRLAVKDCFNGTVCHGQCYWDAHSYLLLLQGFCKTKQRSCPGCRDHGRTFL